ncbi:insecticidal delta-endotoxin Cry8Ea1 family protein, partial [Bacillus wiedmannii]|uniref:insecticidal delta-endotoxin Cry8Ea1 family protein n=1 Tax=Bacillus wiedmannii TaxID=1890302 RepID=UPI001A7EB520
MCANNNLNSFGTIEYQDKLTTILSITGTITELMIASYFGPGVFIVAGTAILADIIPLLWTTFENNLPNDLMNVTVEMLQSSLDQHVRGDALVALDGLIRGQNEFKSAFDYWGKNPDQTNTNTVRDRFSTLNSAYVREMAKFKRQGYERILLSTYAQAANMHLLHLRDGITYAEQWKLSRRDSSFSDFEKHNEDIEMNAGDLLYSEFQKYRQEYTNYCMQWYNESLSYFKSKNQNWSEYNTFRKLLTLSVLDIISKFSSYDPRLYNIPTNMEILTRKIYADPINYSKGSSLEADENKYTVEPKLFTQLYSLEFYSDVTNGYVGHTNKYRFLSNYDNFTQRSFGAKTTYLDNVPYFPNRLSSIYKIKTFSLNNNGIFNIMYFGQWDGVKDETRRIVSSQANTERYGNQVYIAGNKKEGYRPNNFDSLNYKNSTHLLADILSYDITQNQRSYSFAFTSKEISFENTIQRDKITLIPAVKAFDTAGDSQVVKGPGHTGGDLIWLKEYLSYSIVVPQSAVGAYEVRIRYASNAPNGKVDLTTGFNQEINLPQTFYHSNYNDLKAEDFKYATFLLRKTFSVSTKETFELSASNYNTNRIFIDRIEFIPKTQMVLGDIEKQNLANAQKAVDDLFTGGVKNSLKTETTDYEIDQAANVVECLSNEEHAKEKMILLDEVKYAKHLSQSRNVLKNGDFESETLGWTTSNNITIQADNPIFKGNYLHMSGARDIDGTVFPTYVYQKIDESKLKPYTRYRVRGFVGSSKELELVVSRYGEEIDAIMNVPNNLVNLNPPASDCGDWNRCDNTSFTNGYVPVTSSPCQYDGKKRHVVCHDRHQFDFHIDTGSVDPNENIGIWVLFKVSSPDGYATLDNLEVIEEELLVGETLARVKHMEKKWIHQMEAKRYETQQAYDTVKQAIDALFINEQEEALQFDTTLAQIQYADSLVQSVPYVYNDWLSDVPGMNYDMYIELVSRVAQARYLYDARNVLKNGDFTEGLKGWHVTGNAEVQQRDGVSVLVLSNWSEGVAQNVHVQHNHGYVLRVTAKKEGHGKGYITLMDCEDNQETL